MPVRIIEQDERLSFSFHGADIFYRRIGARERATIQRRCIDNRRGRINLPKFNIERVQVSALGWDNLDCFVSESEEIVLQYEDAEIVFRRLFADERERCWNQSYDAKGNTVDIELYNVHMMVRSIKSFQGFVDSQNRPLKPTFDTICQLPQKLRDKWHEVLIDAYPTNGALTIRSAPLAFDRTLVLRLPEELITKWIDILEEYDQGYDTDEDKKNFGALSTAELSIKDSTAPNADNNA